ncbi:MAG TPA: molybdopterin-binding protein [Candidatus Limnocylindrales bacterium]|nr:molybdopterin-binding protein [Candidatus Limnocylindrales bacterium]
MRVERIHPGARPDPALAGAVLTRDLRVGGGRWPKGRRLTDEDLGVLASDAAAIPPDGVSVLVLERGDLHEDDAALRLAAAVGDDTLTARGPAESRVDLLAAVPGVLHVRTRELERINRIDPLEVFTSFDGSVVKTGDLVASIKVAPHVVEEAAIEAGERIARAGRRSIVRVAPFKPLRVAVVVREAVRAVARERFESSVRAKIETLGSEVVSIVYAESDADVAAELRRATRGKGRVDLVLTAGGGSTDPMDPFFVAIDELGGEVVRRGVPSHPGSMVWLGRLGRTAVLGLPTCGAYSKATAADLVIPRLLTGERPSPLLVSPLGHGGILTRNQRFRFASYAADLDAPEG